MALKRETREILTGAATLVVLAVIFVFSYASDRLAAASGYDLIARFRNIDGLGIGSDVRLAGIRVGSVNEQRFDASNRQAVVTLRINSGVEVPTDSAAMIISQGILGSKFMRIEPGGDEMYFQDGDEFEYVQNSVILEDVLEKLIREVEAARGKDKSE